MLKTMQPTSADSRPLTIIIGTYNRLPLLKKCLDSLSGCKKLYTIIVADAGSTDGTIEYLADRKDIRLICDGKPIGQAKSFNKIFTTVKSRYVGWISDDNLVREGSLEDVVRILDEKKDIGMVGLKVKDKTGPYASHPYIGAVWPSGVLTVNQGILRTNLLLRLGGFDEDFKDYGIDIDLTTRVLLAGYKVALTKRVAVHHYRDHETDNWIDEQGRRDRIKLAQKRYKEKFASLIKNKSKPLIALSPRIANSLKWRAGSIGRDFRNIMLGSYISTLDFAKNFHRKYYLVQGIPTKILNTIVDNRSKK